MSFPFLNTATQYRCYLCCIFGNIYLCSSAVISYEKITPKKSIKYELTISTRGSPILGKQISIKEKLNAFYFKMPQKYGMSSIGLWKIIYKTRIICSKTLYERICTLLFKISIWLPDYYYYYWYKWVMKAASLLLCTANHAIVSTTRD